MKTKYLVRPRTALLTQGFDPALSAASARPAVFRSSTYVFRDPESAERAFAIALGKAQPCPDEKIGWIYSRLSHPNADLLEDQIVALEPGATSAAVFNSGMAAISTVFLTLCRPGSTIIHTMPVYGGTHHLIHHVLEPMGIHSTPVQAGNTAQLTYAIENTPNLRVVFMETPANPTLRMSDIAAAVEVAAAHADRPMVIVDNTLLGPVFQHPLSLGADLVVYSATKYLAGFSDMLAGVVMAREPHIIDDIRSLRAILGNILQPDECWLLESRLPTVISRMNRQSKNAQHIAESLNGHSRIRKIHYPGFFDDHQQQRIRDSQCRFPGAMISLELNGGKHAAFEFLRNLRLIRIAVSLGGVESLACHPATTTHSELTPEDLQLCGVNDALVRLSIGVEDWRDLLNDIRGALDLI